MRLAVCGTHGVGKSTLVEDIAARLPGYAVYQEPYWDMVDEGVVFSDPPSLDDMVEQLAFSAAMIRRASERDALFDRCPLDLLAYVEVLAEAEGIDWAPSGALLRDIEAALASLEAILFLPLAEPDEIPGPIERPKLRRAVDARLRGILEDDDLGLMAGAPPVTVISGTRSARMAQALGLINRG